MELKDFIGKIVISPKTKKRYVLQQITAAIIEAKSQQPDERGYCSSYRWETINGDPISNGQLVFEDKSLTEPFKKAYAAHYSTQDAYWENYGYWMRKD